MNPPIIDGVTPINPLQPRDDRAHSLLPFQRLDAQILGIDGTTATLRVDGVTLSAELASQQDAANLKNQNSATFIVSQTGDQTLTLKLVANPQSQTTPVAQPLVRQLLAQQNLPGNDQSLILAEAVLNQRLPITDGLLNELLTALEANGAWTQADAEFAAALKAAGYPISAESLALASARTEMPLQNLLAQLAAASGNLSPELQTLIRENLITLETLLLDLKEDPTKVASALREGVAYKGRSLENILLAQSKAGVFALVQLKQALDEAGQEELAKSVEQFIKDLRHEQFFNIQRDTPQPQVHWAEIAFQLKDDAESARLRIQRDVKSSGDGKNNHLVLQVEIAEGKFVEVDLTLSEKQIRTKLSAEDEAWCQIAERERSLLDAVLQELGYQPKTEVSMREVKPFEHVGSLPVNAPTMRVNIEI
jgi:hypothetical protein